MIEFFDLVTWRTEVSARTLIEFFDHVTWRTEVREPDCVEVCVQQSVRTAGPQLATPTV